MTAEYQASCCECLLSDEDDNDYFYKVLEIPYEGGTHRGQFVYLDKQPMVTSIQVSHPEENRIAMRAHGAMNVELIFEGESHSFRWEFSGAEDIDMSAAEQVDLVGLQVLVTTEPILVTLCPTHVHKKQIQLRAIGTGMAVVNCLGKQYQIMISIDREMIIDIEGIQQTSTGRPQMKIQAAKRNRSEENGGFRCSVCLYQMLHGDRNLHAAKCGHLLCSKCVQRLPGGQLKCGRCGTLVVGVRRLYGV